MTKKKKIYICLLALNRGNVFLSFSQPQRQKTYCPSFKCQLLFLDIKYDNHMADSFLFIYEAQFYLDSVFCISLQGMSRS